MQRISRQDAYLKGMKKFFTEKTCKRGHIAQRYVTTGVCVSCHSEYLKGSRNKFKKKNEHPTITVEVRVYRVEDVAKIKAYEQALKIQYELDSIANGSFYNG